MMLGAIDKLVNELATLLERLIGLQAALEETIHRKLDAMRRVDAEAMLAAAQQEGNLAGQVNALDGQRRRIVGELANVLGIGPEEGNVPGLSIRALLGRMPREYGGRIAPLGDRLRAAMLRVAEANQVVELVCREMQTHFKMLFTALTRDVEQAQTYSAGGAMEPARGARVLDAVG